MKLEFGVLSYKLLIPLLYPIFNQTQQSDFYNNKSPLYQAFINSISYLLAGLVYLFVLYRTKNLKKLSFTIENTVGKPTAINQVYEENQNIIKQRKIKKYIKIFLLSLINIIPTIFKTFSLTKANFTKNLGILFTILFYVFLSKIFLNTKIYKHQIISLITISFCLLIFLFRDIEQSYSNDFFILLGRSLLYFILVYGIYAISDVFIKKHFEIHTNIPYHLMFFLGLFSFILIIPLDLFVYFYDNESFYELNIVESDIIKQIKSYVLNKSISCFFLWFIVDIINQFFLLGGLILTLYYFTPCHFIISRTLSEFLSKCIRWITRKDKDEWYFIIIYIILYIIIIFSSLIYNEVVIIHLWSIEENTSKYITFRQRLESDSLQNISEDDSIDQDSSFLSLDEN